MNDLPGLQNHDFGGGHIFQTGHLPPELREVIPFTTLWDLHPPEFPEIQTHGHQVKIPRWQQAYGVDYRFSGQVSQALPILIFLTPMLEWCRMAIDPALNGLLLNWYDGQLGHYIGRHRDSTKNLVLNSRYGFAWGGAGIPFASLASPSRRETNRFPHERRQRFYLTLGDQSGVHPRSHRVEATHRKAHLGHTSGVQPTGLSGPRSPTRAEPGRTRACSPSARYPSSSKAS